MIGFGRTGKMPVEYVEAATNHMLGTFNVKFSPLWNGATRALVALAAGHEENVWPALEAKLKYAMLLPPPNQASTENFIQQSGFCHDHHNRCVNWEASHGTDMSLFQTPVTAEREGRVVRRQITDQETVMESLWRVVELAPHLLATRSRVLVPLFLEFLHGQYFFFHSNHPDARELNLKDHVKGYTR